MMNELENVTLYYRTIGKKSWVKKFSFPMTEEKADEWITELSQRKAYKNCEFKKSNATHGKSNNY